MTHVHTFTFGPFEENTYLIADDSGECILIDPGCFEVAEKQQLQRFIAEKGLRPVRLINTHAHLDHVFGVPFATHTWNLGLEIHAAEQPVLERFERTCQMYGIPFSEKMPAASRFVATGETIAFGQTALKVLFTPGHSPGSISLYCAAEGFVVAGDVLFYGSIGRTDFPGSNFETLRQSIHEQIFTLPPETLVYAGHGPTTTVRHERETNPYVGL